MRHQYVGPAGAQQDQAGHDEQDEADRDADAGQDGGADDRQDERASGPYGLGQVEVDPAVTDILDRLDQRCLDHVGGGEADDVADDHAGGLGQRQQGNQDPRDQVDHE